ncbi:hypothetical protein [Nonomuraea sp. PA05]|uniref:hypothetical protein n=1 Tax=Nonomuraea sp. PA05 TaxID=2604466 RepID=UPI0011DD15E7|nr:hypothetical protein [Nonomuraea sp. PA05]
MREEYNPAVHGSYASWLRNKGVQTRASGWTNATHDQVTEGRDRFGQRFKRTTDQLGHDVIQHGNDQQSVIARIQTVRAHVPASASKREITDVIER